ncbi:MAG: hypothetical protein JWN79_3399 [Gemmatimonadetes bacterium]|jgi:hypothetical protein|nr:hypothetical protein [Gemmatimonadota bacterium]
MKNTKQIGVMHDHEIARRRLHAQGLAEVERAIEERTIVRTWPMRGTLHFVPAADVRWMLALMTPRVMASAAGRHRALGLDDAAFRRIRTIVTRALTGPAC